MRISEKLTPQTVRIPLRARTKEEAIEELVALLPSCADAQTREEVLQAVMERERRMSTGIGQGIAIPHGKSERVKEIEIGFGIAREPIDFHALDGQPVEIFFLLVSPPEMTGPHIKTLAQISRMLSSDSLRERIARARSAEEVQELCRREEAVCEE